MLILSTKSKIPMLNPSHEIKPRKYENLHTYSRHVIHRSEPAIMQRCYLLTSLRACRSTKQMDHSSESSSERSSSSETNSDIQDSGDDYNDENIIQPYSFEPVDETVSDADIEAEMSAGEASSSTSEDANRLENLDW